MPAALIQAAAPTALPEPLAAALAEALGKARQEGRPVPAPWQEVLGQVRKHLAKLPMRDPRRLEAEGLLAAAAGAQGERAWVQAVRALHRHVLSHPAEAHSQEALARLLEAQGLPCHGWRDQALALRLQQLNGVDPALEAVALAQVKAHWGGFLEPPRAKETLAACGRLLDLWARRPSPSRTEAVLRVAFVEDAGPLWAFAWEEGDAALRAGLASLLEGLEAGPMAKQVAPAFLHWVRALRTGGLQEAVTRLVDRMDEVGGGAWDPRFRLELLWAAHCDGRFLSAALAALPEGSADLRALLLRDLLLRGPDLTGPQADLLQPHLVREGIPEGLPALREAWRMKLERAGRPVDWPVGEEAAMDPIASPAPSEQTKEGLTEEEEGRFREWLRRGEAGELEAASWSLLEAAARGERSLGESLSLLPTAVLSAAFRAGDAEGVLLRMDRAERLLAGNRSPEAEGLRASFAKLRPEVARMARLLAEVGPAARP